MSLTNSCKFQLIVQLKCTPLIWFMSSSVNSKPYTQHAWINFRAYFDCYGGFIETPLDLVYLLFNLPNVSYNILCYFTMYKLFPVTTCEFERLAYPPKSSCTVTPKNKYIKYKSKYSKISYTDWEDRWLLTFNFYGPSQIIYLIQRSCNLIGLKRAGIILTVPAKITVPGAQSIGVEHVLCFSHQNHIDASVNVFAQLLRTNCKLRAPFTI